MDPQTKHLDSDVLKELECPVCMEYMLPPIRLCENGHNICKNCLPKIQTCPTCRGKFIQARNVALENLAISQQGNISQSSSRIRCPFAAISKAKCSWRGPMSEIKTHVSQDHNSECIASEGFEPLTMKLSNFTSTKYYIKRNHYRRVVLTLDELFYIVCKIEGLNLFCVVMYIGPEENTSQFKYRFTLMKDGGKEIFSLRSAVRSYMIKLDHILELGLCVKIDYRTAWHFLDAKNTLIFEVEIYSTRSDSLKAFTRSGDPQLSFGQWMSILQEELGEAVFLFWSARRILGQSSAGDGYLLKAN